MLTAVGRSVNLVFAYPGTAFFVAVVLVVVNHHPSEYR